MKKYIRTAFVLALICAVAATVLALVNSVTAPKIQAFEEQKVIDALNEIAVGRDVGKEQTSSEEGILYYYELSENDIVNGYIVGIEGSGYGGELTVVASYDLDGVILGAKMLANSETPGLGKKAEKSSYMTKFLGTGNSTPVPVKKSMLNEEDAQEVSGASLTFGGVSKALLKGSEFVKKIGGR